MTVLMFQDFFLTDELIIINVIISVIYSHIFMYEQGLC